MALASQCSPMLAQPSSELMPVTVKIYATGTVGNIDSVTVIYTLDAYCDPDSIDYALGERVDTSAYATSGIDMRIAWTDRWRRPDRSIPVLYSTYVSRPSSGFTTGDPTQCGGGTRPVIYIRSEHQPVTLTWDMQEIRRHEWLEFSYITNDALPDLVYPYEDWTREATEQNGTDWAFLVDTNSITFRTDTITRFQHNAKAYPLDDSTTSLIYPIRLIFTRYLEFGYDPPCCPTYYFNSGLSEQAIPGASVTALADGSGLVSGLPTGLYAISWYDMSGRLTSRSQLSSDGVSAVNRCVHTGANAGAAVVLVRSLDDGRSVSAVIPKP